MQVVHLSEDGYRARGAVSSSLWWWFVGIGLALAALGTAASLDLVLAAKVTTYAIGILMLIGGIIQIVHAGAMHRFGRSLFWIVSGLLYLLAGASIFLALTYAESLLTLLLALSLGLSGIARIIISTSRATGWGPILLSGLGSLAAAFLIGLTWPQNSTWALGAVIAIDLFVQGSMLISAGLKFRLAAG
jgi:uncharacterized membrane protein HdeD (DUF308 family)